MKNNLGDEEKLLISDEVKEAEMMLYGLDDTLPIQKNIVYGFQHVIYFVVSAVVMPVVVGALLGLSHHEIASMLQRTFVLCGIISILQAKFGHTYPIIDGPAGLWTGVITLMAGLTPTLGKDLSVLITDLESGMIIAGAVVMILMILGLIPYISKLFTPVINGVLIILMVLQISPSIIKGMLGITEQNKVIDIRCTAVFFVTVILILVISLFTKGFLQSISTLVGVIVGWIMALLLGIANLTSLTSEGFVSLPQAFAWGKPTFDVGITITCIIASLVILSMTFTSVNSMAEVLGESVSNKQMSHAIFIHGLSASFAGAFPTIAFMPYLSSTGITAMTRVAARRPFVLSGVMMIALGIVTPIGMLFASIPSPVGCGALIMVFALITGQGLKEFQKIKITNRESFIIGISVLIGIGAMFLPNTAFQGLPSVARSILPNGMVDGIIIAFLMENLLSKKF
ncbi:purine/pyrimidine permease [Clostridium sp. PL3]|uniref:Purine/pyrimidine permease n=1 Tax=Clostridium thailandense TaxID=2794346 RepID=A0A949U3D7_9CLOT|nr:purine/pyrimidine permease [Clostridium thailandense]MBV7275654.1 purine/pyrimidine permease [Clostridium thailandense]